MRLDMNLLAVSPALLAAAVAQDLIPQTASLPAKVPLLTAAALYYALTKPQAVALTALVWAGGLTDALGGLPLFCTLSFLLLAYWAVRLMQRVFLEARLVQGALLTACAAAAQAAWTRAWAGPHAALFTWDALASLGAAAQAGLLAGVAGFAVCGWIDRLSGVVQPAKESHGILWAETDR